MSDFHNTASRLATTLSIANEIAILSMSHGHHFAGKGALARAGIAYALSYTAEAYQGTGISKALHDGCLFTWPFEAQQFEWDTPTREKLVRAAALLLSEIQRIDSSDEVPDPIAD